MGELTLPLYDWIQRVLFEAQSSVSRAVNTAMVHAYFEIGHLIVLDEQHGKARAEYGEETLKVTTQVPKTTIGGLHYAGTTRDVGVL